MSIDLHEIFIDHRAENAQGRLFTVYKRTVPQPDIASKFQ